MIEALSAIKTSLELATTITKAVKAIDKSVDEAEYKAQLAELLLALSETHINMAELNTLLMDKDTQISELTAKLSVQNNLQYEDPVYWMLKEDGNKDGPYCQKCYDDNNKLIRLPNFSSTNKGAWKCSVCETFFSTEEYSRRRNEQTRRITRSFAI